MPSPFPGMDPFLEGYLWPDVHTSLAGKIRQILTPLIRPKYAARLEVYLSRDPCPADEIGILYPDVEILENQAQQSSLSNSSGCNVLTITPPALSLPVPQAIQVRLTSVEIRDTASNRLVTSIEILSPVNKREPGLTTYRQKRQRLYDANVHLLEFDLLRRGTRPFVQPRLPDVPYCIALTRSHANQIEIWPIELSTSLPVVPVPLQSTEADVPLDLQAALDAIYDEAAYDLSLDYKQNPPPPVLTDLDLGWIQAQLQKS